MNIKPIILTILLFTSAVSLNAQLKPFNFQQIVVKSGTKESFSITVSDGKDSTIIPVSVFHGKEKGPALGIIAGIHGYEYPPIVATQQFAQSLDPAKLMGTIIIVHLANVPAFLRRSIELNPQDGKNLNRVFPGKKDGTITQRLAWTISNEIIARCNYVIDVHSGDANSDLRPYSGYYNYTGIPELSRQGRDFATALGFNYVVQFGNETTITGASVYCSREAIKRGIPAVDIECGRYGMAETEMVDKIKSALGNALVFLHISEGTIPSVNPFYVRQRTNIDSEFTGFFFSQMKAGEFIKKGMTLGYITDLFGNRLSDVKSPVDGVILFMTTTPPINKGENLFSIGHLE